MPLAALRTPSALFVRCLLRVQIDDAIEAGHVFMMLKDDDVEPRRAFIKTNALRASSIYARDYCSEIR